MSKGRGLSSNIVLYLMMDQLCDLLNREAANARAGTVPWSHCLERGERARARPILGKRHGILRVQKNGRALAPFQTVTKLDTDC